MKTKWLGLTMCLLASAVSLRAGEDVQLDQPFSFRLTQPELRSPPTALPVVIAPDRPRRKPDTSLKTPQGELLPPGSRALQFNGQTYYLIPL